MTVTKTKKTVCGAVPALDKVRIMGRCVSQRRCESRTISPVIRHLRAFPPAEKVVSRTPLLE